MNGDRSPRDCRWAIGRSDCAHQPRPRKWEGGGGLGFAACPEPQPWLLTLARVPRWFVERLQATELGNAIADAALDAVRFEGWSADECALSQFVAFDAPSHVRALYREAGYGTRRGGLTSVGIVGLRASDLTESREPSSRFALIWAAIFSLVVLGVVRHLEVEGLECEVGGEGVEGKADEGDA